MKNQYFGDKRDVFKHDLWIEVAKCIDGIRRMLYIPMLTPNDFCGEGSLAHGKPRGDRREDLARFFMPRSPSRAITELHSLYTPDAIRRFLGRDAEYVAFRDGEYFWPSPVGKDAREGRSEYFTAIPQDHLNDAAVMLDPDIGLKRDAKERDLEKYIRLSELKTLTDRCTGDSVLLLFQHSQADKTKLADDLKNRRQQISDGICKHGLAIPYVLDSDRAVAFFAITSNQDLSRRVGQVIAAYGNWHGLNTHASAP
jgi:hypothetical protein